MSCRQSVFQTPSSKGNKSHLANVAVGPGDLLSIPASPAMKKLGFGTGVNVFLLERYSPGRGSYGSPWAIKKINSKLKSRSPVNAGGSSRGRSVDGSGSPALHKQPPLSQLWHSRLDEEAKVLRSLHHPNIIGFRGYSTSIDGTKCLIMESGERDLYTILEQRADTSDGPLPQLHTLTVTRGVASALQYMHEDHHLLHGDIKSANILIKGNFDQVKLCDFGVSLKLDDKLVACTHEFYIGTECWSPPEVINEEAPVTDKSDIFALGLTLWECVSLEPPHVHVLGPVDQEEQLSTEEQDKLSEERDQLFRTLLGTRPALPPTAAGLTGAYLPLLEAFYHCTSEQAEQRPSAAALVSLCDDIWEEWGEEEGTLPGQGENRLTVEHDTDSVADRETTIETTDTTVCGGSTDTPDRATDTVTEECNTTEHNEEGNYNLSADSGSNSSKSYGQNTADEVTRSRNKHSTTKKRKLSALLNNEDKENCCDDNVSVSKIKLNCK